MRPIHWTAINVAAVGWASGGIATRAAFDEGVGEWTLVATRTTIAAVLVVILLVIRRTQLPSRTVMGYGLVRFFIEFARQPDAHLGLVLVSLSMGQLLCLTMILAGGGLLVYLKSQSHP